MALFNKFMRHMLGMAACVPTYQANLGPTNERGREMVSHLHLPYMLAFYRLRVIYPSSRYNLNWQTNRWSICDNTQKAYCTKLKG